MSLAITFREAAERLHVSESTVRRAVSSGDLVAVRIGAARRIRNEDLVRYCAELPTTEGENHE